MSERDLGTQPLDGLMEAWGVTNNDVVETSPEQLTHKQVRRARTGRQLTLKMMMKVTRTFNVTIWHRMDDGQKTRFVEYGHKNLFNYTKGFDPEAIDPNINLAAEVKGK
jgi:hypothetical protein|tara:strand:+ start:260 stop:586 length:327 start_codon:yes stop_codon:yes gene_type:complete